MESVYIPAITYHQVLLEDMPVLARKPGEGVLSGQIYPADFVRQMDFLSDQGFTTITHDQIHRWRIGVGELGPRPIVIDFDDHIEVNLGVAPRHFAYPNGLWNERIEVMVKQVYASARLFAGVGRSRIHHPGHRSLPHADHECQLSAAL
jgi:hypothetical protein